MSDDPENLGPAVAWHIRSIPESVRQHYVDLAHAERCTVAELLTRLASTAGATAAPAAVDLDGVARIAEAARHVYQASGVALPARTARSIYAVLGASVRAARRQGAATPPALPPPS